MSVPEKYSFVKSLKKAALFEWNYTVLSHKAIFYLVTGQMSPKNLSGPVGIVKMSGDAAKQGAAALIFLAAILSTGLAVFNLLPFPALDGGHLIFCPGADEYAQRKRNEHIKYALPGKQKYGTPHRHAEYKDAQKHHN